jgi:hypothetical protein
MAMLTKYMYLLVALTNLTIIWRRSLSPKSLHVLKRVTILGKKSCCNMLEKCKQTKVKNITVYIHIYIKVQKTMSADAIF